MDFPILNFFQSRAIIKVQKRSESNVLSNSHTEESEVNHRWNPPTL